MDKVRIDSLFLPNPDQSCESCLKPDDALHPEFGPRT